MPAATPMNQSLGMWRALVKPSRKVTEATERFKGWNQGEAVGRVVKKSIMNQGKRLSFTPIQDNLCVHPGPPVSAFSQPLRLCLQWFLSKLIECSTDKGSFVRLFVVPFTNRRHGQPQHFARKPEPRPCLCASANHVACMPVQVSHELVEMFQYSGGEVGLPGHYP
jgi:hypothetical protein